MVLVAIKPWNFSPLSDPDESTFFKTAVFGQDFGEAAADAFKAATDELEHDVQVLATAIIRTCGDMDGALSANQGMGMIKVHTPVQSCFL